MQDARGDWCAGGGEELNVGEDEGGFWVGVKTCLRLEDGVGEEIGLGGGRW